MFELKTSFWHIMNVPNSIMRNLFQEAAIQVVALVEDGRTQRYGR